MDDKYIKQNTLPYYLPEPHRSVLNAAVASLVESKVDCSITIRKRMGDDGKFHLSIEIEKVP